MTKPVCGFKVLTMEGWQFRNGKGYHGRARWDGCAKRCPKKGEYFISGAIPTAYKAKADMNTEYFIAVPLDPDTYLPKGE